MSPLDRLPPGTRIWGSVDHSDGMTVQIAGLAGLARIGDGIAIDAAGGRALRGEVIALDRDRVTALLMVPPDGLAAGQRAWLVPDPAPRPSAGWLGHVVDASGHLADGTPAPPGPRPAALLRSPPRAAHRRRLGPRLATGVAALDTLLPLCRGQRLGIFAGSGVGKSLLLGALARGVEADTVVIGLIGERGREVGEFTRLLGEQTMARTVIVAATSDQTALLKRRAGMLTLAVAEHFRDRGRHVLCLFDSLTRFAEAHREIALAAGEPPALRAFPPSTGRVVAALCERTGPGDDDESSGDITAAFTVLVSGSDMEEPVADMVRGILDGHVVLDRAIAERGRFPAIDLARSVSRSAPTAWSAEEAALAGRARALLARYEEAEPMIRAGLYVAGSDAEIDAAIRAWPALDRFLATMTEGHSAEESFALLGEALSRAEQDPSQEGEPQG